MSNRSWKRVILGSIFLILSIFYTVLFFQHANFGQTMTFNIAHLKSLSNIFVSPINFNYWNHSGSLINIFSPWLLLLPGWMLVSLNAVYGMGVYLTLITFFTFVSAYFYMSKFSRDTFESLLFAIIYTFSLNRFFQVFQQQRIENYLVMIFLPMVYYGVYQLLNQKGWHILAWGMTLIVWTSPYTAIGVLLTLLPFLVLMIFSRSTHHFRYWGKLVIELLLASAVTVLTTLGFIGPLVMHAVKTSIKQDPIRNIDYLKWYQGLHFTALQQYLLFGIVVLLGLLLIMIFLQSRFSYKLLMLELIPLTASLLIPVKISGLDLSRLIPALQSISDLFLAVIVSRIVILVFQEGPSWLKFLLMGVAIVGLGFMNYNQASQLTQTQTLSAANKVDYSKFVTNYHDDAINGRNQFLINGQKTEVSFYTKPNDYWIQYIDPESAVMDLPVQPYAGYRIQLNNENVKTTLSDRSTIKLRTQPGKNIIEIHAQYDWISILMLLINLCGFILLIYLSLINVNWKTKKNANKS